MENRPPVSRYVPVSRCIPVTSPHKSFIVPGACFECYIILSEWETLKSCGGCRLVAYCSKDCQRQDWRTHKHFCKVAKALSEPGVSIYSSAKKKIENGKSWYDIVMETTLLFRNKLGPNFGHIDGKILSLPKVCEFCQSAEPSNLKLCTICCAVYYCSEDHRKADASVHEKVCSVFNLSVKCDHFLATKGYPELLCMPSPSKPVKKYVKLPKGMSNLINNPSDPIDAVISDWLSYPLTILYALERIGLGINGSPVQNAKKLTIHLMDSHQSLLRLHMSITWEYLFHRLPNLKRLRVVMIDPELIADLGCKASNNFQKSHTLCGDCEQKGRRLEIEVEGDFRMYKCSDRYERPDVLLAHGVRDDTIEHCDCILPFPEPSIPLVLVSFMKEAMDMNLKFLESMEEDICKIPTQVNPFRGQRPMRVCKYTRQSEAADTSSYEDSSTSLVYANNYICALQRTTMAGGFRIRFTPNK